MTVRSVVEQMNPSCIDANESVAHRSSGPLRRIRLQHYGLAILSVGVALGTSLLLEHFHFRVPSALLLLFAVAISSWYAGAGPAVLAAILSTISFYWYFVEPVHTIYIYRSQIPYFVIFTAFAALLSRFGTFRQRAEADLRRTHDQLKVERPKLGSRTIALLYFAFSSCWILFTDRLVHGLGLSNAYLLKVSEAKGILFISLSTLLMYVLVEKALRQRHSVATAYWQLVETAQEGVWSVDAEGKTVFANENMAAILGTSPGEMIGKSILPFVPQEKKDELLNHLLQREQGLQEHYEFPFLRADGAQVWTLLRVSPVLRDGQHSGCLALVSDITKRKRAEEEVRNTAAQWQATFDAVQDLVLLLDKDFRVLRANHAAAEFLGLPFDKIVGGHCYDLIHGTFAPPAECPLAKMRQSRTHEEAEVLAKKGGPWLSVSVDPLFDPSGELT
ncbi:MAG: PAS domain S-box protein, partial [Terriglobales bacterium]